MDVAENLITTVDDMLDELSENKTAKQQEKTMVGLAPFRKACENRIAEKLDKVMLKTAEQIEQEKARKAARDKAAKKEPAQKEKKPEQAQNEIAPEDQKAA